VQQPTFALVSGHRFGGALACGCACGPVAAGRVAGRYARCFRLVPVVSAPRAEFVLTQAVPVGGYRSLVESVMQW
jgi:hypothetical protein